MAGWIKKLFHRELETNWRIVWVPFSNKMMERRQDLAHVSPAIWYMLSNSMRRGIWQGVVVFHRENARRPWKVDRSFWFDDASS